MFRVAGLVPGSSGGQSSGEGVDVHGNAKPLTRYTRRETTL
jgi:hypothetical protein